MDTAQSANDTDQNVPMGQVLSINKREDIWVLKQRVEQTMEKYSFAIYMII